MTQLAWLHTETWQCMLHLKRWLNMKNWFQDFREGLIVSSMMKKTWNWIIHRSIVRQIGIQDKKGWQNLEGPREWWAIFHQFFARLMSENLLWFVQFVFIGPFKSLFYSSEKYWRLLIRTVMNTNWWVTICIETAAETNRLSS